MDQNLYNAIYEISQEFDRPVSRLFDEMAELLLKKYNKPIPKRKKDEIKQQ